MSKSITPPEDSGWDQYHNTAKRDVVFAKFAYTTATDMEDKTSSKELEELASKIPEGFQLFVCSNSLDETKKHEYRAAVFINNTTKEVIVATSGTRFGLTAVGMQDLYDDSFIAFEKEPPKMESVRELNTMLLDGLGDDFSKYKIHYTGHSLGASISDMAAADLAIQARKKGLKKGEGMPEISTMTFENPGAKKVIEKMYKDAGLNPAEYSKDVDYKGINNGRNLINRTAKHAGKMWEIVPQDAKEPDMFYAFLQYVATKLEPILQITPKILNMIAFGSISKQIDSHKMDHIAEALCKDPSEVTIQDAGTTDKQIAAKAKEAAVVWLSSIVTSCAKVAYNSDIWSSLTTKKRDNGNIGRQEFVMVSPEGEYATSSKTELTAALARSPTKEAAASPAPGAESGVPTVREVVGAAQTTVAR